MFSFPSYAGVLLQTNPGWHSQGHQLPKICFGSISLFLSFIPISILSPPLLLYPFSWIYYSLSVTPKAELDCGLVWKGQIILDQGEMEKIGREKESWRHKRRRVLCSQRQQEDFNSLGLAALCLHPRTHAPHINMPLQDFFFVFVYLIVSLCVAFALVKPQLGNAPEWLRGSLLSL